jgi:hypothetical protein
MADDCCCMKNTRKAQEQGSTEVQAEAVSAILKQAEAEAKIFDEYDKKTVDVVGNLAQGKIKAGEFMEKVGELVKSRDAKLAGTGAVPLKAPKCVGTTWKTALGRQGVN